MQDAVDTAAVAPAAGTFSERVQSCGCRGVPDGQHVAFCAFVKRIKIGPHKVRYAPRCGRCTYRGKPSAGFCPFCGAPAASGEPAGPP